MDRRIIKLLLDEDPKTGVNIVKRKLKISLKEAQKLYWEWRREYVSEIQFKATCTREFSNMRGSKVGNNQYFKFNGEKPSNKR